MNILIKIIAFILLATGILAANNTPTEGSTLQVIATSGLKLRANPNMESATVVVMPLGAEVTLLEFDTSDKVERVEWVDGKWIKVDYKGTIGWAFDGFLTILQVPNHELERCYEDLELLYPVEFWARANFGTQSIDTLTDNFTYHKTTYNMVDGNSLVVLGEDVESRLDLYLTDVRVMEVYQLLLSMIATKSGKRIFKESATFIEKEGTIKHVKINIDSPIEIRESFDGTIRLTIKQYTGC